MASEDGLNVCRTWGPGGQAMCLSEWGDGSARYTERDLLYNMVKVRVVVKEREVSYRRVFHGVFPSRVGSNKLN